MIIDDVRKLSQTQTPAQMAGTFYKKFKQRPRTMLHAHHLAERVGETKAANARGPELKAKVAEILKQNPGLNVHTAWVRAGHDLGII